MRFPSGAHRRQVANRAGLAQNVDALLRENLCCSEPCRKTRAQSRGAVLEQCVLMCLTMQASLTYDCLNPIFGATISGASMLTNVLQQSDRSHSDCCRAHHRCRSRNPPSTSIILHSIEYKQCPVGSSTSSPQLRRVQAVPGWIGHSHTLSHNVHLALTPTPSP